MVQEKGDLEQNSGRLTSYTRYTCITRSTGYRTLPGKAARLVPRASSLLINRR